MNIDEAAGLMDLDLTLTLYWRDTGVSINGTTKKAITINPDQDDLLNKIWFPDIAIDQARSLLVPCQHHFETLKTPNQAKSVKAAKVFLPSTAVRIGTDHWIRFFLFIRASSLSMSLSSGFQGGAGLPSTASWISATFQSMSR